MLSDTNSERATVGASFRVRDHGRTEHHPTSTNPLPDHLPPNYQIREHPSNPCPIPMETDCYGAPVSSPATERWTSAQSSRKL